MSIEMTHAIAFIAGLLTTPALFVIAMLIMDHKEKRQLNHTPRTTTYIDQQYDRTRYERMLDAEIRAANAPPTTPNNHTDWQAFANQMINNDLPDLDDLFAPLDTDDREWEQVIDPIATPAVGEFLMRTPNEQLFFTRYGTNWRWHSLEACDRTRAAAARQGIALNHCVIHNPSAHPLRNWPMTLRETNLIERMCPHHVGHPDPDSARAMDFMRYGRINDEFGFTVHGCDGCCQKPDVETLDVVWN